MDGLMETPEKKPIPVHNDGQVSGIGVPKGHAVKMQFCLNASPGGL